MISSEYKRKELIDSCAKLTAFVIMLSIFNLSNLRVTGFIGIGTLKIFNAMSLLLPMSLAIVLTLMLSKESPKASIPLAKTPTPYVVLSVFFAVGAAVAVNAVSLPFYMIFNGLDRHAYHIMSVVSGGMIPMLTGLFFSTIVPAILEEVLYRGVLMQPLRKLGDRNAIIIAALVFAANSSDILNAVYRFALGVLLGIFAVRTGSLITSVLAHFACNMSVILLEAGLFSGDSGLNLAVYSLGTILLVGIGAFCFIKHEKIYGSPLHIEESERDIDGAVLKKKYFENSFFIVAFIVAVIILILRSI